MGTLRRTRLMRSVCRELATRPGDDRWAYEVAKATDQAPNRVRLLLSKMTALGWLSNRPETPAPVGRPPRQYVRLTEQGRRFVEREIADQQTGHVMRDLMNEFDRLDETGDYEGWVQRVVTAGLPQKGTD